MLKTSDVIKTHEDLASVPLKSTIHRHIQQKVQVFNSIPITYKYIFPSIIIVINLLQLNKIGLINSYDLSMDPEYIFDTNNVQWWRLLSYLLAIDNAGTGIKDVLGNVAGLIFCGYFVAKRFIIQQQQLYKDSFSTCQSQVSEDKIQKQSTAQIIQNQNDFIKQRNKFWFKTVIIESVIISFCLSLVNCFVWFVWTRFGPHTYVSIGFLPLAYYHFMKFTFIEKDTYGFGLSFLPFRMKNKYFGYLIGLSLMIFSMEAQSTFIVMLYFFVLM